MGLWVDKSAPRIEDLERIDMGVSQVATVEGIDVAAAITEVQDEISSQLESYMERSENGGIAGLGDVVVTERLRRWAACEALAVLYRNAYFNQMSERYAVRWKEYEKRAGEAREENFATGIGRSYVPVARPAAPAVTQTTGSLAAGTYFFSVAAVNAGGAEGEASECAVITTQDAGSLQISFGSGRNVQSWIVFAGSSADSMTLQTPTAVAAGATWQSGSSLLPDGRVPGKGQTADYFTRPANRLLRG